MNPLIQLLMMLRQAQNWRRDPSMQQEKAAGGMTPQGQQYAGQLNAGFWNPGGGRMGNDTLGGGQVFGGFYRGVPLSSYYGVRPNVGEISWLAGGQPGQYGKGFGSMAPAWGAQNWLSDLINMSQANAHPYGYGSGSGFLTGELPAGQDNAAAFHGGGQGMLDFFRGPMGQQGMDSMFRGGGAENSGSSPYLT